MIKKILVAALLLILFCTIAIVYLVVFVDPNNFRNYISQTVKEKTGYQLTIDGDLRWHIWPQISILTGAIRVDEQDAKKPILIADNMRLDVALLPLISKKLAVKTIFVKSAVITLTDESKGKRSNEKGGDNTQRRTTDPKATQRNLNPWSYSLNKLVIDDSTVIVQTSKKERLNFRDINITMKQKEVDKLTVNLHGTINRNQRNLDYTLHALLNVQDFPNRIPITLTKSTYSLHGLGLPENGLAGEISASVDYYLSPLTIDIKHFLASIPGGEVKGKLRYTNSYGKPDLELDLCVNQLDLTRFTFGSKRGKAVSQPAIIAYSERGNELAFLNNFDARIRMRANEINSGKLRLNQVVLHLINKNGFANIQQASFKLANGDVLVTGTANGKVPQTTVKLETSVAKIDLPQLFQQLNIKPDFSGKLNGQGQFVISSLKGNQFLKTLKGDTKVYIDNGRLNDLNFLQMIQAAASQLSITSHSSEPIENYTEFQQLSATGKLNAGQLKLDPLVAISKTFSAMGTGKVDLFRKDLDIHLNVNVLSAWNETSQMIAKLQKIVIPLRIYGPVSQLHYQVDLNKLLKDEWQDGLNKLKEKYLTKPPTDGNSKRSDNDKKFGKRLNKWLNTVSKIKGM